MQHYSLAVAGVVDQLPRPLYEDILHGRWLPVIGAGLSRNARVPYGAPPPDWSGLAQELRAELSDPDETFDAVDVISAYSQEHGRPALVERVAKLIRVADALPAPVHYALCRLPIDVAITTNFDLLLEEAFRGVRKPCNAVIDEPQLAITNPFPGPTLMKIHGDINRPERLVLTEEDFDAFLLRNPLLSTIVASHYAQRSIVLIGYSLSDPDLRQMLALIRERLGDGARAIYSLEVDAPTAKIARFARRHVRVVSLAGDRLNPAPALEALFRDLFEAIGRDASDKLIPKTHESALALRTVSGSRACFLSASIESLADYYEWLAPAAARLGVALLTFQDLISPGDSIIAAIDSMLAAVGCAIIEISSAWTTAELGMAINRLAPDRVLIIKVDDTLLPIDLAGVRVDKKPESSEEWADFSDMFTSWLVEVLSIPSDEAPGRGGDALVGSVIRIGGDLEATLGDLLQVRVLERSLGRLLRIASQSGIVSGPDASLLREIHGSPKCGGSRERGLADADTAVIVA